jgi:dTDP-4-dehydrorhamnose reductase
MRILVTGRDGQLGQSLQQLVDEKITTSHIDDTFIFIGKEDLDFVDSNCITDFFEKNRFDVVINCAAFTNVDKAETDKFNANLINHIAVQEIAKMSLKYNMRLIHISTDFVFDGLQNRPYIETDKVSPLNFYGESKLSGEVSLLSIMKTNGIIIRTSGVYSEFRNNFVKTIINLAKKNNQLNIISDQIGAPTYANDLARAILHIINSNKFARVNQPSEIFHYANDGALSWFDFATEIVDLHGIKCNINPIKTHEYPLPAKRPKYSLLNKNKIIKEFGVDVKNWRDSLKNCLKNL